MKKILLASTLALPLAVGGCTSVQEAQALVDIQAGCDALGVGASIALIVTSSLGGAPATIGATVGQDIGSACSAVILGAQKIIDRITNAGGTATVDVTTRSPTTGLSHRRFYVTKSAGRYVFEPYKLF